MTDSLHRLRELWAIVHVSELQMITSMLIVATIWSVICRVNHMMFGRTRGIVFWQHTALALGMLGGLLLSDTWGRACMAAGVFLFLALGSGRWRHGAPADITKPAPLDEVHPRYFPGGKP